MTVRYLACFAMIALVCFGCSGPRPDVPRVDSSEKKPTAREPHRVQHYAAKLNPARVKRDDPLWQETQREVYAAQAALDIASKDLGRERSSHILRHGPRNQKRIALTFDDGPHPSYTPKLLQLLRARRVKATFFVIGFMAEKYPELVRDIALSGHEVGNHSFSHVTLTKISQEDALIEFEAANLAIAKITGRQPRYCRPPGGDFNNAVVDAGALAGLTTVLWTDDPGDYANPGDETLLARLLRKLTPGGIILLHDGSVDTLDVLDDFISAAQEQGYQFVSLDELIS
jgi:peptidoglycan/xylan/chitin deacetylase (PgdA/CDA1 family)